MRIWWCQEHESPLLTDEDMYGTRVQLCQLASWDETEIGPCRMVPMRLIPDRYPNTCPHCGGDLEEPDTLFGETP